MLQITIFAAINRSMYLFIIFLSILSLYTYGLLITSHYFNIVREIAECFQQLAHDLDCRTIVLTAAGKIFSAGNANISFIIIGIEGGVV